VGFVFFFPDSLQQEHKDQRILQNYRSCVFVHVMHLYFYTDKNVIVAKPSLLKTKSTT